MRFRCRLARSARGHHAASEQFFAQHAKRYRKTAGGFDETARERLMQHSFPGNVRELDHVVERAVLMSRASK